MTDIAPMLEFGISINLPFLEYAENRILDKGKTCSKESGRKLGVVMAMP